MTETPMQRYLRLREEEGAAREGVSAYDSVERLMIGPENNSLRIEARYGDREFLRVTVTGARWLIRELTRIVGAE